MDVMERIGTLLEERHIEQKTLCEHLGIGASKFSDWKSGRVKSYNKYLPDIAEFFNVSVDYLLGKSDKKEKSEPDRQALLDEMFSLYDQLTDAQRAEFIVEFNKMINKHRER